MFPLDRFQKQEEKIATLTARNEDLSAQNADAERKISSLQKNYQLSHQTYLNEKQVSDEKTQQLMDLNVKLKEAKTEIKSKADFIQVRPLTILFYSNFIGQTIFYNNLQLSSHGHQRFLECHASMAEE